jgi:hypothetical protein
MVAINNFFLRQSAADTHTRFETTNEQRRGAARRAAAEERTPVLNQSCTVFRPGAAGWPTPLVV